jgi:hypothetical protein
MAWSSTELTPPKNKGVTTIADHLIDGEFLPEEGRYPVVIGRGLAEENERADPQQGGAHFSRSK